MLFSAAAAKFYFLLKRITDHRLLTVVPRRVARDLCASNVIHFELSIHSDPNFFASPHLLGP